MRNVSINIALCIAIAYKIILLMITYITEQILTNIIWNMIVCKILKLNILKEKAYQALYWVMIRLFKSPLNLLFKKRKYIKSDIFLSDYEFCMVKTEQTVTAKTAMLLQFWRGKVIVFFLNYLLSMQISMRYLQLYPR